MLTGAVCLLSAGKVLSWFNWDTVAGRGTTLQSHAPRQLQTHACTHTRARARASTRAYAHKPQSSCRDALTRSAQKHWHASGGRHTFQLMSGSFSAVTAKICLSCLWISEGGSLLWAQVCPCPTPTHVPHFSNTRQGNYYLVMVYNQWGILTKWLTFLRRKSEIRQEFWLKRQFHQMKQILKNDLHGLLELDFVFLQFIATLCNIIIKK